jgi:hypothetical protein
MRRDDLYLHDIVEATHHIGAFIEGAILRHFRSRR